MFGKSGNFAKVPTILQMESTECGVACLAMVLAHYGSWIDLETLRRECGVGRDGCRASSLVLAARKRGCTAKGMAVPWRRLSRYKMPLIIHWEFNHFLVLEGLDDSYAYVNDPAVGHRKIPIDQFKTSYTGICLVIEPGENFQKEGTPYSVTKVLAAKIRKDKWALAYVLILGFCMIIPELTSPIFEKVFIDDIMSGEHPDWWHFFFFAMVGAVLLLGVMKYLRQDVLTKWDRKTVLSDSSALFHHLLRLPMRFFQQRYASEIANRVDYTIDVSNIMTERAATAALDLTLAVFYFLLMLQYSVPLTLISVLLSAVVLVVYRVTRPMMTELSMRVQQERGKEYGTAMNGLMMIETIKANGGETEFFSRWSGHRANSLIAEQELYLYNSLHTVLPVLLAGINAGLIVCIGGYSIMEGAMTAGMFMAFRSLSDMFSAPVGRIMKTGIEMERAESLTRRLDDVWNTEEDKLNYPDVPGENEEIRRLNGEVDIRDISFGYVQTEAPLLDHFSLHLEPGQWAALVGSSGSGKSTVARVLLGLEEEWSGEIKIDGINRRDISRRSFVASVSMVEQDICMFEGTIRDNITLFDSSIPRRDMIRAAEDACIHEDILRLAGAYESPVLEGGANFSGGQKQRIAIARALAKNPSVLVLDEATSALDPITELQIMRNIRRRGCTCLVVAHRLSTIRDCDEIIVLDHGREMERGTHSELMALGGHYRDLITQNEEAEVLS